VPTIVPRHSSSAIATSAVLPTSVTQSTSATLTSSTPSSSPPTTSTSSSATASPLSTQASARKHPVAIGVAVGGGVLMLVIIGALIWRYRRRKAKQGATYRSAPQDNDRDELQITQHFARQMPSPAIMLEIDGQQKYEMDEQRRTYELDSQRRMYELSAD
ncbi:hypothetical protein LTR95_017298, partial [Oleoguttula sp. CCFEE 5521]